VLLHAPLGNRALRQPRHAALALPAADEAQGGSAANRPGGLSAATAKRFKHEKTLVMLNPSLSAGTAPSLCGALGGWVGGCVRGG
jgi:hypothetical protein